MTTTGQQATQPAVDQAAFDRIEQAVDRVQKTSTAILGEGSGLPMFDAATYERDRAHRAAVDAWELRQHHRMQLVQAIVSAMVRATGTGIFNNALAPHVVKLADEILVALETTATPKPVMPVEDAGQPANG